MNKNIPSFRALKYSISLYHPTKNPNTCTTSYLLSLFLTPQNTLLIPEITWLILKTYPKTHKLCLQILPNFQTFSDYILFNKEIPQDPTVNTQGYKGYYTTQIRCKIWEDLSKIIVEDKYKLEGVLH
mmetsp:Transcript_27450/g.24328  ORF Transcript_27450/g.24328 Transcript_27450/m.24328 type:complete len:127 (+) Transcript_27450:168-548(+)